MGLSQSLWTGLSSIKSHQTWTDVISNNLSQSNTDGFKYSNVSFSDIMYQTLKPSTNQSTGVGTTNASELGLGVSVGSINQVFSNGDYQLTSRIFDCGLEGNGFFILGGLNAGTPDNYFTRNGSFYFSAPLSGNPGEQNLQSANGLIVQGYQAVDGIISDTLSDITLPIIGTRIDGVPTSELTFEGNLNSQVSVINGNSVPTVAEGTTTGGWMSNTAATINVGGVESSGNLINNQSSTTANSTTDLTALSFERGSGNVASLFSSVPAGFAVDSREITVEFTKGEHHYTETFVYGEDGTTLNDFATWLTGGVGDAGDPATQRINGGALGTVRTREYTVDGDGYAAPAEQAGSYFGYDTSGNFNLSIASNLGRFNTISDIKISTVTAVSNASTGETRNLQTNYDDFFNPNPDYKPDDLGGSAISPTDIYLNSTEPDVGTIKEEQRINYTLISRDSNGSTWRWFADGNYSSVDEANLNKGTGTIRFGTTSSSQVEASTIDGGTDYTMDFSAMTQVALDNSPTIINDGCPDGELDSFTIDQHGVIDGTYTNGLHQHLARIGMALIPNANGLIQVGDTMWQASGVSGSPIFNTSASDKSFGIIKSHYLETSNVDMANEMTKLLLSQRGYQLGSKIVTTADDMLQEAANMKR